MSASRVCLVLAPLALFVAVSVQGQDATADKLTVPFSDPTRPGTVRIGLINGGITVKAHAGREVIIEARSDDDDRDNDRQAVRGGLRRIPNRSSGLTVEEDDNVMRVSTSSHNRTTNLVLQVPVQTSLKLSCTNDGDINVDGVTGDVEANNTNGAVRLTNVSGSVVAHAFNDDLTVSMVRVDPQKPMSFSSFNGDIDVTLPANLKATVKMQTEMGDIYSDFDMQIQPVATQRVEDTRSSRGRYQIRLEKVVSGAINGGGPEISFKNYNGDIRIRKGAQ
jgi:DUF4097 and DUF4098 domain-containing protein YvlB